MSFARSPWWLTRKATDYPQFENPSENVLYRGNLVIKFSTKADRSKLPSGVEMLHYGARATVTLGLTNGTMREVAGSVEFVIGGKCFTVPVENIEYVHTEEGAPLWINRDFKP